MLRYSLGSLCLILLYASVGCAGLVNATGIWPQVVVSLTVAVLLVFTLAAVCWDQRPRVFALGFSITGWAYFLLVFASVLGIRGYLLTDTAADLLFLKIHGERTAANYRVVYELSYTSRGPQTIHRIVPAYAPPAGNPPTVAPVPVAPPTRTAPAPAAPLPQALPAPPVDPLAFGSIAHSLWTVILACLGGAVAQLLHARGRRGRAAEPQDQPVPS